MYLGYQQVVATAVVKTIADLTIPAGASHVELQADTQQIRYTMDDTTDPTQTVGMLLLTTEPPKAFLIEDLRRVRFVRGAATDGVLNVHYSGGRQI